MFLVAHVREQLDKKPMARVFLYQDYGIPPIVDHLPRHVDELRHVLVRTLKRAAVEHRVPPPHPGKTVPDTNGLPQGASATDNAHAQCPAKHPPTHKQVPGTNGLPRCAAATDGRLPR